VIIIYFSKFGLKIRALVENQEMAEILGINKKRVFLQIFLLAALIAFLTGIFYGWEYALEPSAGTNLVIKSFTASIIAGLEIMPAAFFGGYLLAFIENFSIIYLPSSFKDGISFFILFLFLLLKPKGIFGRKKREEIVG
jgi:branched-chain amino acid transport system permease protein